MHDLANLITSLLSAVRMRCYSCGGHHEPNQPCR